MNKPPFALTSTRSSLAALCVAALGLGTLAGCAPLVVGGAAATTAAVASDRRTAGEQVEDKSIQMKISHDLANILNEDTSRYNIVSYAGRVLLLGDVPSEAEKQQAEEAASKVENVTQVLNQLRIGDVTPLSVRSNDSWLTTKVTTALVSTKGVPTRTISVTTERGIVYMMGKVTSAEAHAAAKVAAGVSGVNKVVTAFQIVTPESLTAETDSAPMEDVSTTTLPEPTQSPADVEVLPVQ